MSTATKRRPRVKPARFLGIRLLPADGHSGVLKLTVGKETRGYYLDPLPAAFGRGFRLVKFLSEQTPDEPTHYDVLLNGEHSTCECRGFLKHQHCKHRDGLLKIADRLPSLASAARHNPESVLPSCPICNQPVDASEGGPWHEGCANTVAAEEERSGMCFPDY